MANVNPIRYRSYYYDAETNLYYLQSRYYDPEMGRFLNADGYVSTGQGITGNNMFAYCLNNPVCMVDNIGNTSRCVLPCTWIFDELEYKGEIHAQVQRHILQWEPELQMEVQIRLPSGKYGRADIISSRFQQIWEVKHNSSVAIANARAQLRNYMTGTVVQDPSLKLQPGGYIPPSTFTYGKWEVRYWFAGRGVILYSFSPKQERIRQTVPSYSQSKERQSSSIFSVASFAVVLGGPLFLGCGGGGGIWHQQQR